jgi:hypothetical protein
MLEERVPESRWRLLARRHAGWILTAAVYAAIMSATTARLMSDTVDYAGSIASTLRGEGGVFWEFGHLLWRPAGYLTCRLASPLIDRTDRSDLLVGIVTVLIAWNWVAGLVGALALHRFLSRLGARPWSVAVTTLAYIVSFGVLNYAHSGSSYVPGLACLLVALALLVDREAISTGAAIGAGIALAGAVGFWALYILVIPAALAFPLVWFGLERRRLRREDWPLRGIGTTLIWFGVDRRRLRRVGLVAACFVLMLGSSYAMAIQRLGIRDLAGLRSWVAESSHGIVNIGGVSRVAFGIPRSFVSMGQDGVLYKRFLLKDPYNPVTLGDLVRLSLAKVALVYAVLLATLAGLLRGTRERRLLVLMILGGLPVLAFAVKWQGGDVERYMPAYPLVFAAWALVLGGDRPLRLVQALVLSLVGVMGLVNLPDLSRTAGERARAGLKRRADAILPSMGPGDVVYVVAIQDPLFGVERDPLYLRSPGLEVRPLLPLGHAGAPRWRNTFAQDVRRVWDRGGTAWISARVLSPRPRAEWNWVEGDEKSVRWSDLPSFFEAFELGRTAGDDDGFVALAPTPHNGQLVRPLLVLNNQERR